MTIVRRLSGDAAAFLERSGDAIAFVDPAVPGATAAFLAKERSRLGARPGAGVLDEAARAVRTRDHDLGDRVVVRSYEPAGAGAPRPVLLYAHGGGWVSGGIDQHDSTCRVLAAEGDLVVLNVDYRLAPEHPFPVPLDDCWRALTWASEHAGALFDADPARLGVAGSSSGGNLAAALAIRARDEGGPRLGLQVLVYPALDASMSARSHRPEENGRGYFVSTEQMRWYWDSYRGDGPASDEDPWFSPLAARSAAGLPPALIVTAEFDLLRDDGVGYHEFLSAAGIPVRRIHFPGQIHGFAGLLEDVDEAYPAVTGLGRLAGGALRAQTGSGSQSEIWWS